MLERHQALGEFDDIAFDNAALIERDFVPLFVAVDTNANNRLSAGIDVAAIPQNQAGRPDLGYAKSLAVGAEVDRDIRRISAIFPMISHA